MTNKLLPLLSLLPVAHSHSRPPIGLAEGMAHREDEWEYFIIDDDDEAVDGIDETVSEYPYNDESNHDDDDKIHVLEDSIWDEQLDDDEAGSADEDDYEGEEYLSSTPIPVLDNKRAAHSWESWIFDMLHFHI
eukprot:scaffold173005_cov28-Cyclotella_meneghiniana.AAC.1